MNDSTLQSPRGHCLRNRRARSAFTLIEMLVVIGILMILSTIAVLAYRHLERSAALTATQTALHNGEALLAELRAANGSGAIEAPSGIVAIYNSPTSPLSYGDVNIGGGSRSAAAQKCQVATKKIATAPAGKKILDGLSPKMLIDPATAGVNPANGQVLADGWGNPIVLCPAEGFSTHLGLSTYVGDKTKAPLTTIQSPTKQPFWASAGPDGDFSDGDDNVYSFEKQ